MKRFHLFTWLSTLEEYRVEDAYEGSFETLDEAQSAVTDRSSRSHGEVFETQTDGALKRVSVLVPDYDNPAEWHEVTDA